MSERPSAEIDPPIWCLACNVSSEGTTYLAFIHEHAECVTPPAGGRS